MARLIGMQGRARAAVIVLGGALAMAVVAVAVAAVQPDDSAAPTAAVSVPAGMAGQPLSEDESASCVYGYSPEAIAEHLDFAFDGTVVDTGAARSNRAGGGQLDLVGVTFRVDRWFTGGTAPIVVVDMSSPAVDRGTRLLVSGAARWGGDDPTAQAIAWEGCGGFTRYYDADLAATWDAAIG